MVRLYWIRCLLLRWEILYKFHNQGWTCRIIALLVFMKIKPAIFGSGASRYDGKSFRNFTTKDGLSNNDVNSVIEDKTGKFWFATRGDTFVYDGKTFTVFTHDGKPFTNVRSMIEDKKGNIWLGGADGLWRYDGSTFTNFTQKFVGHIIEDKKGNIWTCSESAESPAWVGSETGNIQAWALSRYDGNSLSNKKPTVSEIKNKGMIFGISNSF